MKYIDIVDIKQAVKIGELKFYVKDNKIYCCNTINEVVEVGEIEEEEC